MDNKKMKKIENYWKLIGILVAIASAVVTCFSFGYRVLKEFDNQNKILEETAKIAQKSLIWNDRVPKVERAEVCDIYLSNGYDSYTKKLCENVILQDDVFENERKEEQ